MVMPLTLQDQLIAQVSDPNGTVAPMLEGLWDSFELATLGSAELRFLYVKRAALAQRMAEEYDAADITVGGDVQDAQSQLFEHLKDLHDACIAEIAVAVQSATSDRAGASGSLSRTRFRPATRGLPDPDDPRYAGDPLRRSGWGSWS